jgi:2'-5' RNA ligase
VPAHLTLFHQLPPGEKGAIQALLERTCRRQKPIPIEVGPPRLLGQGVAFPVSGEELHRLRRALATEWQDWLVPQEESGFRPHVTVQNKVGAAEARALQRELAASVAPFRALGTGLRLWSYLGGPWRELRRWRFAG